MSPQDAQLLQDFLNQLVQARGLAKDPEAEAMIQKAVSYQPDAAYLLVQRALLQQQALDNAKAEIARLQQQLRGGQQGGGFLDPDSWGNSGGERAYPQMHQQPHQQHTGQPSLSSRASRFFRGGGMGGALGNIASTAAGVAAGAFLFQGLGNLFDRDNHDGNGFLGDNDNFNSLSSSIDSGGGVDNSGLLDDIGMDSDNAAGDSFDGGADFGGGDDSGLG